MKKRVFLFDRSWVFFLLFSLGFGIAAFLCLPDQPLWEFLLLLFLSVLFWHCGVLFFPFAYFFDARGVTVLRLFLPRERYLWKNVRHIYADEEVGFFSASPWALLFNQVFRLEGQAEGKGRRYMEGTVRHGPLVRRAIERYYDGVIEGPLKEDIRAVLRRHREKQEGVQRKQNREDRAAATETERELRAAVRRRLKAYLEEAEELGVQLKRAFLYQTNEGEEYSERPDAAYTYLVSLELSLPNEQDENRILCLSADLLVVRQGKKRQRRLIRGHAVAELCVALDEKFDKIRALGAEKYFSSL